MIRPLQLLFGKIHVPKFGTLVVYPLVIYCMVTIKDTLFYFSFAFMYIHERKTSERLDEPMKRFALLIPVVLSLLALVVSSTSALAAAQDPPPPPGFHVEVQMLHCIVPYLPCNTPGSLSNSLYTQVEVDSFVPGKSHGTPDHVVLACGYAYLDNNHVFHDVAQHVFAGFDPGTITGDAALEGNYNKNSTNAVAEIEHVKAYDKVTGDTAWVNGRMVTNNVTALRVSGGFKLKMYGPIYDEYTDAKGNQHSTKVGVDTFNCDSSASYVKGLANGPYFVAFVGNSKH